MSNVNKLLKTLEDKGYHRLLSKIILFMYKLKGKDARSVKYISEYRVWEFQIGEEYYYSTGPGWVYDYDYLVTEFSTHLGFHYLPIDGDCVVDVGAGVGEELMIFSKRVGVNGKVFAIEAHPNTYSALVYNHDRNKLENVITLNVAIADLAGSIFIEDTQNSLANKISKEQQGQGFEVKSITIAELVMQHNIKQIDFMKVNIEGAEQLLIKGIGDAIYKIKNMAISCHDFRYKNEGIEFFKTKELVLEFLRDNNFECVTRNTGNPLLDDYVYAFPKN